MAEKVRSVVLESGIDVRPVYRPEDVVSNYLRT